MLTEQEYTKWHSTFYSDTLLNLLENHEMDLRSGSGMLPQAFFTAWQMHNSSDAAHKIRNLRHYKDFCFH